MFYPLISQAFGRRAQAYAYPVSKIICVGRNYAAHAKELSNPLPKEPLLFIKSVNCLVQMGEQQAPSALSVPTQFGECQHELEIAVLVGEQLCCASPDQCAAAIEGIGLAIDFTLRELQQKLKQKGHPWERAKSFDGACPVSIFYRREQLDPSETIEFSLIVNQKTVQQGDSRDMIFDIPYLLSNISQIFSLEPGDIVLTGTPAGVAAVQQGDQVELLLQGTLVAKAQLI